MFGQDKIPFLSVQQSALKAVESFTEYYKNKNRLEHLRYWSKSVHHVLRSWKEFTCPHENAFK